MCISPRLLIALLLPASQATVAAAAPTPEQLDFFEKKVRPLLAESCYSCHSNKAKKLKAGLLLDHGSTVLEGGDSGPSVVPGDPDKSLLIEAVRYKNPDMQMPPKKRLAEEEIAALEEWVKMGAPWPNEPMPEKRLGPKSFDLHKRKAEHWCWQPLRRGPLPEVEDKVWGKGAIDRYILAELEAVGLSPAEEADRRVLIRRVSYDLIGLPPSAAEVQAFLDDESADAYEKVVDRLLASPHFGERWARHWMDLVRYAESCGHEFDYPIHHAHEYRDYLIRAFNADIPYDRFVTEHVAGDLVENPRLHPEQAYNESVIGTGFWFLHEATHAPTDVRGDEAGRVDNQIDVMSKTFLGVTVSCARCHDHMFDAISTKDYYALAGYIQSSRHQQAFLDPGRKIASAVAQLEDLAAQEAELKRLPETADPTVLGRYLMAAREVLAAGNKPDVKRAASRHGVDAERLAGWVRGLQDKAIQSQEHPLYPWAEASGKGAPESGAGFASKIEGIAGKLEESGQQRKKMHENATLLPPPGEWLREGSAFDGLGAGRLRGVLHSPTFDLDREHILIKAKVKKGGISIRLIIDGYVMEPFNGLLFRGTRLNDVDTGGEWKWLHLHGDLNLHQGRRAHLEIIDHGDGSAEIAEVWVASGGGAPPGPVSEVARRIVSNPKIGSLPDLANAYGWLWKRALEGKDESPQLLGWLRDYGLATPGRTKKLAALQAQRTKVEQALPAPKMVQAMVDGTAEDEFVFLRGNHKRTGDLVPRRFLTALGGEAFTAPEKIGSGRLTLARQMVAPENPLTPRVAVNRLWHHLFGVGIVPSTDDFGVLGKLPTHPELLDHLAASFVDDGWSIKRQVRRMVLSNTYRMSSVSGGKGDEVDPTNSLLHRARVKRLQGEAIRDGILAISGRLDRRLFGKPIAVHVTPFMTGRGRPGSGPIDGAGRRSIYTSVKRNFLSPMMLAFDTPIPFSTMGKRPSSNVPAQALILMNDPFVIGQAEIWAKRIVGSSADPRARIEQMYQEAFSRPPAQAEVVAGLEFVGESNDVAVWKDFAHVLFNTKEFIFIE